MRAVVAVAGVEGVVVARLAAPDRGEVGRERGGGATGRAGAHGARRRGSGCRGSRQGVPRRRVAALRPLGRGFLGGDELGQLSLHGGEGFALLGSACRAPTARSAAVA